MNQKKHLKEKSLLESKSFEDIGTEDLSEQEFQDIFDLVELLIRVENRLRSERAQAVLREREVVQS